MCIEPLSLKKYSSDLLPSGLTAICLYRVNSDYTAVASIGKRTFLTHPLMGQHRSSLTTTLEPLDLRGLLRTLLLRKELINKVSTDCDVVQTVAHQH